MFVKGGIDFSEGKVKRVVSSPGHHIVYEISSICQFRTVVMAQVALYNYTKVDIECVCTVNSGIVVLVVQYIVYGPQVLRKRAL